MKLNKLFYSLFTCLLSLAFTSCGNDEEPDLIIDYSPITIQVNVRNSNGENLLEPSTQGNILEGNNTFTYDGKTSNIHVGWPKNRERSSNMTRYYMPMWYGAFIAPAFSPYSENQKENAIYIGEFEGGESGTINMELNLGENKYEISVKSKVKGTSVKRDYSINGKKNNGSVFDITL